MRLCRPDAWILGGYQSEFARNLTREGLDFADLTREIVEYTLAAAKINTQDIGGYLITVTSNMNTDSSYCLAFDAARVGDGPVCKLALPERVSSGTRAAGAQLRRWRHADSAGDAIEL